MNPNRRRTCVVGPDLTPCDEDREQVPAHRSECSFWLLQELRFAWYEAQIEARTAYLDWCRRRESTAYATYRAAQDRADAAQDALAESHASAGLR